MPDGCRKFLDNFGCPPGQVGRWSTISVENFVAFAAPRRLILTFTDNFSAGFPGSRGPAGVVNRAGRRPLVRFPDAGPLLLFFTITLVR
jgi:hypothetical protein